MTDILSEVKMRNQRTTQTTHNSTKKGTAEEFRKKLCVSSIKKHLHGEIYLVLKESVPSAQTQLTK